MLPMAITSPVAFILVPRCLSLYELVEGPAGHFYHHVVQHHSKQALVFPVTLFSISSSLYPAAIFAATLAIGYPVALEASALDRLTLGFTSIT